MSHIAPRSFIYGYVNTCIFPSTCIF